MLTAAQVAETAASIAAVQREDGAIPFAPTDPHLDAWNHVEAAMALLVAGLGEEAERAYDWVAHHQRADGSLPMRVTDGVVEDASGDTNMSSYVAVGVWHHWLLRRDAVFVERMWPVVARALDWVCSLRLPWGGVTWSVDGRTGVRNEGALLTGSSSVYLALRCGLALAGLRGDDRPAWRETAGCLGHAIERHRDRFLDRSRFAMDWYYPVLGSAVRGDRAEDLLRSRWHEFVDPGWGVRCVVESPWHTGAETSELAMALDAVGERERGVKLLASVAHSRHDDGAYRTGYVVPDAVYWPDEVTTYTSAAVLLATDALTDGSAAAGLFRGESLPPIAHRPTGDCGCVRE